MIGKKGILRFFYKVTMVCYKKLHLWRIPIPGRDKVQADLNRMHPGENPQECVTDYYVTKLTLSAVILIAGIVLAITMHYSSRESHVLQNQWVYRGSGEEGSREYSITGQVEDGERYSFQMEVMPRDNVETPISDTYKEIVSKHDERGEKAVGNIERFAFYDEAKTAYCIISTSEKALYANIMLQKGVVINND